MPSETSSKTTVITRPARTTAETPAHSQHRDSNEFYSEKAILPVNLTEYAEIEKHPYALEYFGARDLHAVPSVLRYAQELDEYVQGEIERLHLDNSFEAYKSVVKEIEKTLRLNPNERPDFRMQKVARWVKQILLPQRKLEEKKKQFYA